MFYVGGPGRTYSETRLGRTDLGLAGVKLQGLRPGKELYLRGFLNFGSYPTRVFCFNRTKA